MAAEIALIRPKYVQNLASTRRAAACLGADKVWYTGQRMGMDPLVDRIPRELRMKAYDHIDVVHEDRIFDKTEGMVPVAIELLPGSQNLFKFNHPVNALYVFGPEDGDIPPVVRRHCHHFVHVPMDEGLCMNLAATVNIVLYDRLQKEA
jgi:tRNA(Leu) C34 or U34 (ribose-2'-O)-methylase TrmL